MDLEWVIGCVLQVDKLILATAMGHTFANLNGGNDLASTANTMFVVVLVAVDTFAPAAAIVAGVLGGEEHTSVIALAS
jgi:hypothetical protein